MKPDSVGAPVRLLTSGIKHRRSPASSSRRRWSSWRSPVLGRLLPSGWRNIALIAAGVLLAAAMPACTGEGSNAATSEKTLALEAKLHSLEESLEAMQEGNVALDGELQAAREENAALKAELADLGREVTGFAQALEAAGGRQEQTAESREGQAPHDPRLDDLDSRLQALEYIASQVELALPVLEKWLTGMDQRMSLVEGDALERTARLAEAAGGEVYYIDHPDREESAILVMPQEPMAGSPLMVSLHGYGGNSADHALYVPLHERVVGEGFGLLLPNGIRNANGQRFWNPTDPDSSFSKAGQDDFAYLAHLVAEARTAKDFGPVYFFGHSNGGFMAYHVACRGLPGLRAVASLAGTSYYEDSHCEGAPPVSVLHIHGTADAVVSFDGADGEAGQAGKGRRGYAGAEDMARRWGDRAGCDWPEDPQPYAALDLDGYAPGAETRTYRLESGCAEGINVELWVGEGSGHGPAYGDAFTGALLRWLLAQR